MKQWQEGNLPTERELPKSVGDALAFLNERQLGLPMLLFLAGHRPLAFMAGQLLLLLLPLSLLLPSLPLRAWAELLSHPQGPILLQHRLAEISNLPPADR